MTEECYATDERPGWASPHSKLGLSVAFRVVALIGIILIAVVGPGVGAAAASPALAPGSALSVPTQRTPCPPEPGEDASPQEKEDYAVALYIGCEPPPPMPWDKRNCGIVTCSTYISRHAVKIIHEGNGDADFWQLVQDGATGLACDKIAKKLKFSYPTAACVGVAFGVGLTRELAKDAYAEAAKNDTCVKESFNAVTQAFTWTVTDRDNKYCLE